MANNYHQVLLEPDRFSGRTKEWDTWLMIMKAKLWIDGVAIRSSKAQFFYMFNSLVSKV